MSLPDSIARRFALWYRRRRGCAWREIARAETAEGLAERAAQLPSGDTVTLPIGDDPNRSWPRVPG